MKVDSIRITINRMSQISGSYYIYPAQPEVPLCSIPPWVPPDSIIYNSDSMYPNKLVEVVNSGVFDGARLVTIAVYPLQYRPLSRRVFLVSNVTFEFKFSPTSIPRRAQKRGINVQKTYDAMLAAAVENDWEIPLYYQPPTLVPDKPPMPMILTPATAAYVIIANDEISGMAEAFRPFAEWLTDKGIPAVICSLSTILTQYQGDDAAEKLRNFFATAYNNGTAWILLGGDGYFAGLDTFIVPFRKGYVHDDDDDDLHTPPSDLYFSDMNGDWDFDRDHRYGEPNDDSVDIYPEVLVGRILAYDSVETKNWVNKILYYEQCGSTDLSLFQQATWIYAVWEGFAQDEFPDYFTHDTLRNKGANEAVQHLSEGTGFNHIYCHGFSNIFETVTSVCYVFTYTNRSEYYEDGLNHLTNYHRYNIIYDIACLNAAYDNFDIVGDCPTDTTIADAFTDARPDTGAVAFLGNTRLGQYNSSQNLHKRFCQLLFGDEGMYSLGAAEGWSKTYMPHTHELRHIHNLFGSPENEPWINQPGAMEVDHPDYIRAWQPVQFTVTVQDNSGPIPIYLPGVRVCLHKNDELPHEIYEIGWTDNNGEVTFEICASDAGELKVTCFRPRQENPNKYTQYLPSRTICVVGMPLGGEQAEKQKLPKELSLNVHSSILSKNNLKLFYGLPKDGRIKITVYDPTGREMMTLKDERKNVGYYADAFNLNKLSNGIYWLILKSGNETKTKKLVLIR